MKRLLIFLTAIVLGNVAAWGQAPQLSSRQEADYSKFIRSDKQQTWVLEGIASNEYYTGIFIKITINDNREGAFSIPKTVYISGPWGSYSPVALTIAGKDYDFGKYWHYNNGNKGKYAKVMVLFPRIPAGVNMLSYYEPNFISWQNIDVVDNPDPVEHTEWTEANLRSYWETNRCSNIEGIYYFTSTSDKKWWGENKHTLAVLKDGYQYKIIYLKGSNKYIWKEGDTKGYFIATASPGLYKATSWFMENKMENEDFYLQFNEGFMSIYEQTASVKADFLKLYPANDINDNGGRAISSRPSESTTTTAGTSSAPVASGSGIFVGNKVIATNYHVIEDARKIEVSIKTGNDIQTYEAKVLSTDKTNDLALIHIEDAQFEGIGSILYNLSARSRDVGTSIFTMGYPLANYMGEEVKITDGIISSKTGYEGDIVTYQISAPIQPGNSGGPLFDKNGNLIGITNAGIKAAQNVGYAIKSSYLFNLIESAPISIQIPESDSLVGKDLTEQIKCLSKYVVFIKIY